MTVYDYKGSWECRRCWVGWEDWVHSPALVCWLCGEPGSKAINVINDQVDNRFTRAEVAEIHAEFKIGGPV